MTRISAIVRADNGGLGTLSRLFAEHLGFQRTVSLSRHEGEHFPERFGDNNRHAGEGLTAELVEWLCRGADVLLTFECWYGGDVPAMARALGCKTANVIMYECCPERGSGLEHTDLAICPTMLDWREASHNTPGLVNAVKTHLPVPCDTRNVPYRARACARTFVHNMGHGGIGDRNNTAAVIEAWRHVTSPAVLLLRTQGRLPSAPTDSRIRVQVGAPANYWDLWREGDVLLHPTRWDALSLPMREACAAGMPVMTTRFWPHCDAGGVVSGGVVSGRTTHRSPLTTHQAGWLPASVQALAIERTGTSRRRICREFMAHETTPAAIARAVDAVYGRDIRQASDDARRHALECGVGGFERYRRLFDDLAAGRQPRSGESV
ncbi:MAG TPA: hypothetical protein VMV69_21670 [Pirellulales bacterium]|nr:hypothetical protein [Pirellulales bacterium]